MSKMPPIPPEQRHFGKERPELDKRPAPDGQGSNINERGQTANIRQNLTPQRSVQDR
jgi:hypothetical protein